MMSHGGGPGDPGSKAEPDRQAAAPRAIAPLTPSLFQSLFLMSLGVVVGVCWRELFQLSLRVFG